jgi:PAS domain S-box-containing protein
LKKTKSPAKQSATERLRKQLKQTQERLRVAEEALRAIRDGGVDALVLSHDGTEKVYTVRGAEEPYRLLVEAMSEGAVTISLDGTILYSNKSFADLLKQPLEKVIGAPIQRFISAYDKDTFNALFYRTRNGPAKAELLLRCADESLVNVYCSLRSFHEFGADAVCMVVTDLTGQKRNEAMLSEGKLAKLIVNQAAEAIAVCDSEGKIVMCNRILDQLAGRSVLFQPFDEAFRFFYNERDCDPTADEGTFRIQSAISGQVTRGVEVCLRREDEEIPLLLSAAPIKLPGGSLGCVITLFNIEERKRAEATLRKSEKLAATGQLAATIAHEINNPLEAVTNLLFLIGMNRELPDSLRVFLSQAEQELSRISHITRQTLAFHRESKDPLPASVRELVGSVVFLYERKFRERGIELIQEITFDGKIYCFENEVRQLLSNLVVNALDATPNDGRIYIRVYACREQRGRRQGVRIVIADTGRGIPPENRSKIFGPFFTTKGERGTGLGLWVSETIVHKHHGTLAMRSSTKPVCSGTVFSVFLPLRRQNARRSSAVA